MQEQPIRTEHIERFARQMRQEERSPGTVEKYLRDVRALERWLNGRPVTREFVAAWRDRLLERGLAPSTVNSMLSAANSFLRCLGREDCLVKLLRVQRRTFREQGRELTREDYRRLVSAARSLGRSRLALLLETICSTGIRVSEVRCFTVESVARGRAEVRLKGKIRTILIPARLGRKLAKYAQKHRITSGEIFLTRGRKSLSRRQIWREMKDLCQTAGVEKSRVFPHNLRHLFATVFYQASRDIVKLADVLGHSSINTTRIYLMTTGEEHARQLERLGLVT